MRRKTAHFLLAKPLTIGPLPYIAAGYAQPFGHHPLGLGLKPTEPVAHADNLPLPGGQGPLEKPVELFAFQLHIQVFYNGVVHGHGVQNGQGVSILIGFNRIAQGHILGAFAAAAEKHEDFVFNAPGRVAGQADPLRGIEGIHGFD